MPTINTASARYNMVVDSQNGHQVARRRSTEGRDSPTYLNQTSESQLSDALIKTLASVSTSTAPSDQLTATSAVSATGVDPNQALASFVQDLFGALGSVIGSATTTQSAQEGLGLTKEALASSLEEATSSDSNRNERNAALLNNFDAADADGNGAISKTEAHAFNEANGFPTIESVAVTTPDQAYASQAYSASFGSRLSASLQEFIAQMGNQMQTSTDSSSSESVSTSASEVNPLLQALESSYSNLTSLFGGDGSIGSLKNFLVTLRGNLGSLEPSGNVIDTVA